MTTGERIRELRKAKKMTMEELGERVGVQKSAINKYEKGIVTNLRRDVIRDISKALGCSPAYLMGWTDIPAGFEPIPTMRTVPVIGEIACGVPALAGKIRGREQFLSVHTIREEVRLPSPPPNGQPGKPVIIGISGLVFFLTAF